MDEWKQTRQARSTTREHHSVDQTKKLKFFTRNHSHTILTVFDGCYKLITWLRCAPTWREFIPWRHVKTIYETKMSELKCYCHLHGQTGLFTVWTNGNQNSGLVNFVPETRLPFVNQLHLPKNGREGVKLVWRCLWRNGIRISVWNIPSGKTGLPFQMFRCSRKFSTGKTQKVLFHLLSKRIFRKLFGNGKQPRNIQTVI